MLHNTQDTFFSPPLELVWQSSNSDLTLYTYSVNLYSILYNSHYPLSPFPETFMSPPSLMKTDLLVLSLL